MSDFKKQEYIHVHSLLSEVVEYLDDSPSEFYMDIEDVEAYQEYLENDIKPTSIHKAKSDHREAMFLLADSIDDFLSGEEKSIQP